VTDKIVRCVFEFTGYTKIHVRYDVIGKNCNVQHPFVPRAAVYHSS
jgi:hypothetical protein